VKDQAHKPKPPDKPLKESAIGSNIEEDIIVDDGSNVEERRFSAA
jgi:hypothetical protein